MLGYGTAEIETHPCRPGKFAAADSGGSQGRGESRKIAKKPQNDSSKLICGNFSIIECRS